MAELFSPVVFSKKSDEWGTPQDLFDRLHEEFHFELDVAADATNHKVELWFGQGGVAEDALVQDWGGMMCWMNPPYSRAAEFIAKARAEADKGATVVMLLPSRTDTKWWHETVWDQSCHQPRPGVSVRFLKGRLKFVLLANGEAPNSAPFPSCVVIFTKA